MSNGLLYVLTVAIWGSTWLAIEFQLGIVDPNVSVFYRYTLAATLLIGWCRLRRRSLRYPLPAHLRFMALGLLMFCLNYVLTYHAQVYIVSALADIAFTAMLWMNMIFARLFFGTPSSAKAMLGSLLGVAGVVIIFFPQVREVSVNDATLYGFMLASVGALLASLGNMVSQEAQLRGLPIVESNAWGMAYGALFTGIIAVVGGSEFRFDPSAAYVLSLLYLAVFGSIVAFGAYLTLLGRIGAHKVGYAVVMIPMVAVLLSVLFEGMRVTPTLLVGVLLVLAGNTFVLQGRKSVAPPVAAPVQRPADNSSSTDAVNARSAGSSSESGRAP